MAERLARKVDDQKLRRHVDNVNLLVDGGHTLRLRSTVHKSKHGQPDIGLGLPIRYDKSAV